MLKPVRVAAAAAGLVVALALTGCGSGDDGGDQGKASASPTESAGQGGDEAQKPRDVEGTWAGVTDAKPVVLSVKDGKAALLADGHACTGAVEDHGGQMLSLMCADGNTDRTMGAIESNDGTTLVVSWDAGKKDTLKKSDGASLPEGLPTALPTS